MGLSIQVNDFRWEPGTNDAEYIKLLESSRDDWERIAQKAISKLKTLSKAQEPITPKRVVRGANVQWRCGACDARLGDCLMGDIDNYCRQCGRAVKWK